MLLAAGVEKTSKKARQRLENALGSGLAAEKFERVSRPRAATPRSSRMRRCSRSAGGGSVQAPRTGVVQRVEPKIIGRAVVAMGAGASRWKMPWIPRWDSHHREPRGQDPAGEPIASVFAKGSGRGSGRLRALQRRS